MPQPMRTGAYLIALATLLLAGLGVDRAAHIELAHRCDTCTQSDTSGPPVRGGDSHATAHCLTCLELALCRAAVVDVPSPTLDYFTVLEFEAPLSSKLPAVESRHEPFAARAPPAVSVMSL